MENKDYSNDHTEVKLFIILAVILLFLLIISFVFSLKTQKGDLPISTGVATKTFPVINTNAKAIYVYDIRNKTILYAQNEDVRLSLASLTKIMSALVAEDLSPTNSVINISKEALQAEGDNGLLSDEKWALKDILDFSLITSSNDGMRAVALTLGALSRSNATSEEIINDFVIEMNLKAQELGLKDTYFINETGLDITKEKNGINLVSGGAYGTARDVNAFLEYVIFYKPKLLEITREDTLIFASIDNRKHLAKNTNIYTNRIPGLLASKTGSTNTAGGNLVFVFDPELGRPIIVTILGSTENGRFVDADNIVNAVLEYIANN